MLCESKIFYTIFAKQALNLHLTPNQCKVHFTIQMNDLDYRDCQGRAEKVNLLMSEGLRGTFEEICHRTKFTFIEIHRLFLHRTQNN